MTALLDPNLKYFFRDKDGEAGANLKDGLAYCAAGVVESFECDPNGEGSPSGKDMVVVYLDPWGTPNRCWRALKEVHLTPATASDYDNLRSSIESFFDE